MIESMKIFHQQKHKSCQHVYQQAILQVSVPELK